MPLFDPTNSSFVGLSYLDPYFGGLFGQEGSLTAGQIKIFITYLNMLSYGLQAMCLFNTMRAAHRIETLLAETPEIQDPNHLRSETFKMEIWNMTLKNSPTSKSLFLEKVTFHLEKDKP